MPGKTKKYFEVNVQRGRRSKLQGLINMKPSVYDDSSFNNIIPKKPRRKPVKCGSKTWKLIDVLEKKGDGVKNG